MSAKHGKPNKGPAGTQYLVGPGRYWGVIVGITCRRSKIDDNRVYFQFHVDVGSRILIGYFGENMIGVFCDVLGLDNRKLNYDRVSGKIKENLTGEVLEVYVDQVEIMGRIANTINWLEPILKR